MHVKAEIMDANAIDRSIARITYEILEKNKGTAGLCIVGIYTRGAQIAKRVAAKIKEIEGTDVEIGFLDITPYRDDRQGKAPAKPASHLPFSLEGRTVILMDDVMYTGRSVRAAIDGLFTFGRPQCIQLAVLVDRGHRELPMRADYVGKNLPTSKAEAVKVFLKEVDGESKVVIYEEDV